MYMLAHECFACSSIIVTGSANLGPWKDLHLYKSLVHVTSSPRSWLTSDLTSSSSIINGELYVVIVALYKANRK